LSFVNGCKFVLETIAIQLQNIIMKTSILTAAMVAALSVPIASAQDKPMPAKPRMEMGMGMGKAPQDFAAPAMNMDTDKQKAEIQANMERMQQQMDKVATTTDPKERQKLMQEHMQTMQETMKVMRGMGGSKMKGSEHGGAMMRDKKPGMQNGDMQKRQDMTDTRIDMMQDMMEQIMKRDKASTPMGHM
jgi:hypothetical protein